MDPKVQPAQWEVPNNHLGGWVACLTVCSLSLPGHVHLTVISGDLINTVNTKRDANRAPVTKVQQHYFGIGPDHGTQPVV